MISLNAILSKREGPDYLFSSKNSKALRDTVHNLWQSCLWHSVDIKLLRTALANCVEKCLEVEQGRSDYGEENVDLVRIREVLEQALQTNLFLCMMSQHSPSYVVQGLPPLFEEAWGWLKGDQGIYRPLGQLPWDDHCVISAGKVFEVMTLIQTSLREDAAKSLFVYSSTKKSLLSVDEFEANERKKRLEEEAAIKKKPLPGTAENNEWIHNYQGNQDNSLRDDPEQLTFYTRNAFSDARVLSSSSVKINYLINQISRYQSTEKCIIFSQHYNEMCEIYLALQLAHVRVLMYQDSRMVCKNFGSTKINTITCYCAIEQCETVPDDYDIQHV